MRNPVTTPGRIVDIFLELTALCLVTGIAGAYWRGNAKNPQLQRIYGIVFPSKEELKEYLQLLEEAKKRDHRRLGGEKPLVTFGIHLNGKRIVETGS